MGNKKITIKNHKQEAQLFKKRHVVLLALIILFIFIIIMRLVYLQIYKHRFYSTLSRQNLLYVIPVEPNRGLIYDRNGVLLAQNIPEYSLDIVPARVKHISLLLKNLQQIISITPHDIKDFLHSLPQYRPFQPVPLKSKLTDEEVAKIYVNQYRLPGVSIQTQMMRYYPLGDITGNVVGYVGRINEQELKQVNAINYSASQDIGKTGIEKYYESLLHGTVGANEAEVDANGHIIRILKHIPPIPGDNIYLTIDSKLQAYGENLLGDNDGAIVAIQPSTGQILALITKPDFDPNLFVNGITQAQYQQLLHAKGNPLYNRDTRGLYAPASTIKPFFTIGGLNYGIINPQYSIHDPGWFRLPNTQHIYHDWSRYGHGTVNLSKAIMVSCDIFFYNLAVNMGIERMDHVLHMFGFGRKTGIDMPDELPGIVPSPQWKRKAHGQAWYTGDTIVAGIGQGYVLVTPLQLAAAVATIAEHGARWKPYLLLSKISPGGAAITSAPQAGKPVILNDPTIWNTVISAMENVVTNPLGTAVYFGKNASYTVAAKTGTAQVYGKQRDEERSQLNVPENLRNHHLFIMFAPVENPQIAIAIIVEHASYADAIARKLTDFYFTQEKEVGATTTMSNSNSR